jgi:hypothetical protein
MPQLLWRRQTGWAFNNLDKTIKPTMCKTCIRKETSRGQQNAMHANK